MIDFLFPEVRQLCGIMLAIVGPPVLIGIACLIWRAHMAMNHPEKYRRFRDWEEEETARQKKILGDAAAAGAKIASKFLKR